MIRGHGLFRLFRWGLPCGIILWALIFACCSAFADFESVDITATGTMEAATITEGGNAVYSGSDNQVLDWTASVGTIHTGNYIENVVDTFAATLAIGADGNDVDQTSLGKLEFFDAGLYLDADADGVMDLTSDGTLELHSADWDISTTGVQTNMGNITSDGTITSDKFVLGDDEDIGFGGASQFLWETADADAHSLFLVLPEGGGGIDVPVFIIGDDTIFNTDIDRFEGTQSPTLVIMSDGATKRVTLKHDGTDAQLFSSSGDIVLFPVGNNVVPNADNDVDLGTVAASWKNLYIDGQVYVDGNQGLSATYNFGGGGTGDIATMTFNGGSLTGVTTVP